MVELQRSISGLDADTTVSVIDNASSTLSPVSVDTDPVAVKRALALGLEAAASITDRTISTFSRGERPHFAGLNTFLNAPYLEDAREVGQYDAAIIGVPQDSTITYQPGTRLGPQAIRRISALYPASADSPGIDWSEGIRLCDLGDIFTIPSNAQKSFDQISRGVAHVLASGALPVILGGDHSIGFANLRGISRHLGNARVGVIHFDRHLDSRERGLRQRMQSCPWFHATHADQAPARNLVQLGIGARQAQSDAIDRFRQNGGCAYTVTEMQAMGLEAAARAAIERACDGTDCVYISFDIDCIDAGFVPGTGWHEPGGLQPADVLRLLELIVPQVPVCGLEVLGVSPPHDISDMSSLMATQVICTTLAQLVHSGQLPRRRLPTWISPIGDHGADSGWS
jgi:agmatinase